jgi:putative endonuclease
MSDRRWSVYLLRCADGTLYCGCTNDLPRRLAAHGRGRVKYTRGRLPVTLAHVEPAADKSAALRREHAWKRLSRAEKLRRIAGTQITAQTSPGLRRGRKFVIAKGCGKLQGPSA